MNRIHLHYYMAGTEDKAILAVDCFHKSSQYIRGQSPPKWLCVCYRCYYCLGTVPRIEEHLATLHYVLIMFHLPNTKVMRLFALEAGVIIPSLETVDLIWCWSSNLSAHMVFHPGRKYGHLANSQPI